MAKIRSGKATPAPWDEQPGSVSSETERRFTKPALAILSAFMLVVGAASHQLGTPLVTLLGIAVYGFGWHVDLTWRLRRSAARQTMRTLEGTLIRSGCFMAAVLAVLISSVGA